jgi:uncharacterized protein YggE
LDQTGTVLNKAVEAGSNSGHGIRFAIEDTTALYEQALDLAIKNAMSKGRAAAKSLGATIGAPIAVVEGGSSYTPVEAKMAAADSASGSVPVMSGELTISASATLTFNY